MASAYNGCSGRLCGDKKLINGYRTYRYSPKQCGKKCMEGSNLCKHCYLREATQGNTWHGRMNGNLPNGSHIEGSKWNYDDRAKQNAMRDKKASAELEKSARALKAEAEKAERELKKAMAEAERKRKLDELAEKARQKATEAALKVAKGATAKIAAAASSAVATVVRKRRSSSARRSASRHRRSASARRRAYSRHSHHSRHSHRRPRSHGSRHSSASSRRSRRAHRHRAATPFGSSNSSRHSRRSASSSRRFASPYNMAKATSPTSPPRGKQAVNPATMRKIGENMVTGYFE